MDQLLDQYGLTYTGTAEQTDLTTLLIRAEKVDDFDTGLKHFLLTVACSSNVGAFLWIGQYSSSFGSVVLINRITQHIEHAAQCILSDRHADRCARCDCLHTANQVRLSVPWRYI